MQPIDPYEKERRGSFISGSVFGGKTSKSQSMTSLTSSSHRQGMRKESTPASIGGGGRIFPPMDMGGGLPFDSMLKGEGLSSRRGSQISMHSDRSMSMKWYVSSWLMGQLKCSTMDKR